MNIEMDAEIATPPPLPSKPGAAKSIGNGRPMESMAKASSSIKLDAPKNVQEAKIHIIRELATSESLIQGLYEISGNGKEIYESQRLLAEQNIQRAKDLLAKMEELDKLKESTNGSLQMAKQLESQWFEVEQQMYRSLQPFSMPGIKSQLEYSTKESEDLSEVLAASFLEGTSQESVAEFIRQYRNERTTYHLRNERLQRLNEDRVS